MSTVAPVVARRSYPNSYGPDRLELGCGPHKVSESAVGIDQLPYPGVDIVGDIPEVLSELDDCSFDVVYSRHVFEHLSDVPATVKECARLLRPGGFLVVVGPHFSNPHYYSDPTHQTPLGLYTMSYLAADALHQRAVPRYAVDSEPEFRLVSAEHKFRPSRSRPLSYVVSTGLEVLLRRSVAARERYEAQFTWLWPCRDIRFELVRFDSM